MLKKRKDAALEFLAKIDPLYVYLLVAAIMEAWLMVTDDRTFNFHKSFIIIPCLLFLGTALARKKTASAKRALLLCGAVSFWFVIIQTQHNYAWTSMLPVGLFFSVYLLAYPFAAVAQDGEKQIGLKIFGWIYIAASMVLVALAGLLCIWKLPYQLSSYVYWDGARLTVFWHPNICACIFMIGIAFCLGFLSRATHIWQKLTLLVLIFGQLCAMALTNCRTSILMTCALIGGFVFFLINKGGWKRFLVGIIAAVVIIAVLFSFSSSLYQFNNDRLVDAYNATYSNISQESPVPTVQGNNGQGALTNDLRTLNGRTTIWFAALTAIRNNPSILLTGVSHPGKTISEFFAVDLGHSHNSWVEILLGLGIPGLIAALYFTWIAVKNSFILLFRRSNSLWIKSISMLVLCLLMAGFMEPFLFLSNCYYHFIDFAFFLCIGYCSQWLTPVTDRTL